MLKGRLAFTLVELLVVLVITIILAVIALPTFLNFIEEYRVSATGQDLLYNLQYARTAAIENNQTVYVTFSTTQPWCYGINAGSACVCSTAGSCGLGSFTAPSSQSTVLAVTGLSSNSLKFEGSRGAAVNGKTIATFTAYGGTSAMSVEVTALGNMTLCSTTISGYSACP